MAEILISEILPNVRHFGFQIVHIAVSLVGNFRRSLIIIRRHCRLGYERHTCSVEIATYPHFRR